MKTRNGIIAIVFLIVIAVTFAMTCSRPVKASDVEVKIDNFTFAQIGRAHV